MDPYQVGIFYRIMRHANIGRMWSVSGIGYRHRPINARRYVDGRPVWALTLHCIHAMLAVLPCLKVKVMCAVGYCIHSMCTAGCIGSASARQQY